MLAFLLAAFLVFQDGTADKPTAAQVEQAHQLLNGDWEIITYTDDGETLGQRLVSAKLAKNGRVTVASRSFQITNPETGETRLIPFRVNPNALPRQITITSKDDRTLGGIYKFDGDNLIVCIEQFPDAGTPSAFDAPPGSNRLLIKLHMVTKTTTPIDAAAVRVSPNVDTADSQTARATFATERKPTSTELTRVRELFSGNWDITSIMDDGENLGSELIRRRFAENGQIRFGTRAFARVDPRTEVRNVNAYKLDPTKSPSEIDVTTQFDSVLKGIYRFDGDKLAVCLAKDEDHPRPKTFDAPGGSGRMLVNMKLAKEDATQITSTVATLPTPAPKPVPSADEEQRRRDAAIRKGIVGSWIMTDGKGTLTTVFQPDGGFVATRTWSRGNKRLFGPPSDSSSGNWSYTGGRLSAWVSTTTDARIVGHYFGGRVQTIGDESMVITDAYGSVKSFRKLR